MTRDQPGVLPSVARPMRDITHPSSSVLAFMRAKAWLNYDWLGPLVTAVRNTPIFPLTCGTREALQRSCLTSSVAQSFLPLRTSYSRASTITRLYTWLRNLATGLSNGEPNASQLRRTPAASDRPHHRLVHALWHDAMVY